jgi:hypothetical protein
LLAVNLLSSITWLSLAAVAEEMKAAVAVPEGTLVR